MLHSCAVIDRGNGILFAGVSTAGKSTTARLWGRLSDARVLNDDHTIVRKINDEFCVYGTPWHGIAGTALAEDAPLKKIFILKHAPTNQAVRLPPAQAAAMLLVCAFASLWSARPWSLPCSSWMNYARLSHVTSWGLCRTKLRWSTSDACPQTER